jgi:hypothetical protein
MIAWGTGGCVYLGVRGRTAGETLEGEGIWKGSARSLSLISGTAG